MPLGDPEAYMAQGMPPEEAMALAGGAPPMGLPMDPMMGGPMSDPMGAMPMAGAPDQNTMLVQLVDAVLGKWAGDEASIAGEKDALMQVLMMLAGAPAPMGMPGTPEAEFGPEPELGMPAALPDEVGDEVL